MCEDNEDKDFYFPIDLQFDEFDWPHWGADSDITIMAMHEGTELSESRSTIKSTNRLNMHFNADLFQHIYCIKLRKSR